MNNKKQNIYLRKDGRWEGRYRKGRKPNGRIHYGYIYRKTYSDVVVALQLLQKDTEHPSTGPDLKFSEWVPVWLERVKPTVKLSTYAHYQYKMTQYILPFFKHHYIGQLDELILYDFLAYLEAQRLKASSIRSIIQVVKQCLRPAFRQLNKTMDPFEFVLLPKLSATKSTALTRQEQLRLEKTLEDVPLSESLPVLLALHTGMRIGEIAALQWKDIAFDQRILSVHHTYQRVPLPNDSRKQTTLVLGKAKTDTACRRIPMTTKVWEALHTYAQETDTRFVCERHGRPQEPRALSRGYKRIAKRAALTDSRFHQLRHTFATRCMEAQGDIASISALLGHRSTQMTLDVYSHTQIEQQQLTIQKFEQLTSTAL